MRFIIPVILAAVVLVVDEGAYRAFQTPKSYVLPLVVGLGVVCWWSVSLWHRRTKVVGISVIEILLITQLVWIGAVHSGVAFSSGSRVYIELVALAILALLARQIIYSAASKLPHTRQRSDPVDIFLRTLWLLGGIEAVTGLSQWLVVTDYNEQLVKTVVVGTLGAPNGYGAFIALAAVAAVKDMWTARKAWIRYSAGAGIILMVAALLLNGSRGAMLGLACAIGLLGILNLWQRRQIVTSLPMVRRLPQKRLLAIAGGACVSGLALLIAGLYALDPASASSRFLIWDISWPMVADHPLTGVGPGRFGVEYLNYQAQYFAQPEHAALAHRAADLKTPHSEYLGALGAGGIINGILFLSIWGVGLFSLVRESIRTPHRRQRTSLAALGALLCVAGVHGLVDDPLGILPVAVVAYAVLGFVPTNWSRTFKITNSKLKIAILVGLFILLIQVVRTTAREYPAFHTWRDGLIAAERANWTAAIHRYEQTQQRLPKKSELKFHLGAALSVSGSYSRGIYFMQQSLRGFNDRNIYLSLSYAHMQLGDLKGAERYAKHAQAMFPDHLSPRLLMAEIYFHQGRIHASKEALRACIWRQTYVQSEDVEELAQDARRLWRRLYGATPVARME